MKFRTISDDYVPSVGESYEPNSSLTDPTQAEPLSKLVARFKRGEIRLNSSSGAYYDTVDENIPDEAIDASSRHLNDFTDLIPAFSANNTENVQSDGSFFGATEKAQQKNQPDDPEVKKEVVEENVGNN